MMSEDECAICHVPMDVEKCVITCCRHMFHDACLEKWARSRLDINAFPCPLCRTENGYEDIGTGRLILKHPHIVMERSSSSLLFDVFLEGYYEDDDDRLITMTLKELLKYLAQIGVDPGRIQRIKIDSAEEVDEYEDEELDAISRDFGNIAEFVNLEHLEFGWPTMIASMKPLASLRHLKSLNLMDGEVPSSCRTFMSLDDIRDLPIEMFSGRGMAIDMQSLSEVNWPLHTLTLWDVDDNDLPMVMPRFKDTLQRLSLHQCAATNFEALHALRAIQAICIDRPICWEAAEAAAEAAAAAAAVDIDPTELLTIPTLLRVSILNGTCRKWLTLRRDSPCCKKWTVEV